MNTSAEPISARVSAFVASASAIWQRPLARISAVLPRLHRGFRFAESMHGEASLNGVRHDMVFRVAAEAGDLRDYLQTGRTHLSGHVTIKEFAEDAPLSGELWFKPLSRLIRYEFTFRDRQHRLLTFRGQKDLQLLHLKRTLTRLPGQILDDRGHKIADARLRFRTRDLPSFLRSFRLA